MAVLNTPEQISTFQFVAVRAAIKLEKVGLKHSGGSMRKRWAATLDLKPRDSHDKFIEELTKRIDAAHAGQ